MAKKPTPKPPTKYSAPKKVAPVKRSAKAIMGNMLGGKAGC